MKKTTIFITIIIFLAIGSAQAQYKLGVGLRLNYGYGLSIKYNMSRSKAFEGILYSRWRGINLTGLYEVHQTAFKVNTWRWYYGVGGHVGYWGNGNRYGNPWFDNNNNNTILGADGILGLEHTFKEIPLNLSIDWKPAFNIVGYTGLWLDDIALTARLAIK